MRRFLALIAIPLLACVVLAGCGSSKSTASSSSSSSSSNANSSVTATGSFGKLPKVIIPKAKAGSSLAVKTLIQGTGTTLTKSDALAANFVLYFWDGTSSSLKASTFHQHPTLIPSNTLPGLETALIGKKVGSRVLAVIPPAEGYGTSGNSQIGVTGTHHAGVRHRRAQGLPQHRGRDRHAGVQRRRHPAHRQRQGRAARRPLTFPSSSPPSALVTKTLVKGNGAKVVKGDYVIAQYVGYIWRTKKLFGSSWSQGSPFGFIIGASPEQVIPGWDKGLEGQTVGSRVMLSIPPAQGYGKSGASQAGIKGNDTLVFVVDILDALKQG